jgi:5-hydroxyisourate hydrolase
MLYDHDNLKVGTYRLVFDVAAYFKASAVALPEPNFLNRVSLDFGVADASQHYHVPLLVSPWSYSTYRGS